DWSSDVCSSDRLRRQAGDQAQGEAGAEAAAGDVVVEVGVDASEPAIDLGREQHQEDVDGGRRQTEKVDEMRKAPGYGCLRETGFEAFDLVFKTRRTVAPGNGDPVESIQEAVDVGFRQDGGDGGLVGAGTPHQTHAGDLAGEAQGQQRDVEVQVNTRFGLDAVYQS